MTFTLGNTFESYNDPSGNPLIALDRSGQVFLQSIEFPDGTVQTTAQTTGATGLVTVAFSATPVFKLTLGNSFKITLAGNVSSSILSGGTAGQNITFQIIQDATGGRTFVWPTNVKNAMSITGQAGGANETSIQTFFFDGTNAYGSPGTVYP